MGKYDANEFVLRQIEKDAVRVGTFKMAVDPSTGEAITGSRGQPMWHGIGGSFTGEFAGRAMDYPELMARLEESQYRQLETFQAGMPFPGSGWYHYPAIEGMVPHWEEWARHKYSLEATDLPQLRREGWGLENLEAVEAFKDALTKGATGEITGANMYGFPVIDKDTASRLAFGYTRGDTFHEATYDDILDFFKDRLGLEIPGGKNPSKRLKALMSLRGFGNMETGKTFKVGLLESQTVEHFMQLGFTAQEAEDLVKTGMDGASLVRKSTIEGQIAELQKKAEVLRNWDPNDLSIEGRTARRRGESMWQAIHDPISGLRAQLERGRMFGNTRVMGLEVYDLAGGQIVGNKLEFNGQMKGDQGVIADEVADRLGKNVDIFTAGTTIDPVTGVRKLGAVTDEIKMTKARLWTFEAHRPHDVYLDVQSLSSFPGFFDPQELQATMESDFEKLIAEPPVAKLRRAPEPLATMIQDYKLGRVSATTGAPITLGDLRNMVEDLDLGDIADYMHDPALHMERIKTALYKMAYDFEDRLATEPALQGMGAEAVAAREQLQKSASYVREIRDVMENETTDIRDLGEYMRSFLSSYRSHLTKTKKGVLVPRFRIPDAKAAGIQIDDATVHLRTGDVAEGALGYNVKQGSWIFNQKTWTDLAETYGGADLDDTLVAMLRWDDEVNPVTGKAHGLRAVTFRQPNALTEFALLNVDPADAWVEETLRSKGVSDIGVYSDARKAYSKAIKDSSQLQARVDELTTQVGSQQFDLNHLMQELNNVQAERTRLQGVIAALHSNQNLSPKSLQSLGKAERDLAAVEAKAAGLVKQIHAARELGPKLAQLGDLSQAREAARGEMMSYLEANKHLFGKVDMRALRDYSDIAEVVGKGGEKFYKGADKRLKFYDVEKDTTHRGWDPKDIMRKLHDMSLAQGQLGMYSNFRMTFDTWMNAARLTPDEEEAVARQAEEMGLPYHRQIDVIQQEKAIDPSIQGTGEISFKSLDESFGRAVEGKPGVRAATLGEIQDRSARQMIENLFTRRKVLGEAAPGLDRWMVANRLAKSGTTYDDILQHFEKLKEDFGADFDFEAMLMDYNDPRATGELMANRHKESLKRLLGDEVLTPEGAPAPKPVWGGKAKEFLDTIGVPDMIAAQPEAEVHQAVAGDMLQKFYDSIEEHKLVDKIDPTMIDEDFHSLLGKAGDVDWGAVHADALEQFIPFFEKDVVTGERYFGDEAIKRAWNLSSLIHSRGSGWRMMSMTGGPDVTMAKLMSHARMRAEQKMLDPTSDRYAEIDQTLRENRITEEALREAARKHRAASGLMQVGPIDRGAETFAEKIIRKSSDYYGRADKGLLSGLSTKTGKVAIGGILALGALGMMHSHHRKERTAQELQGPTPQLPGGAPYGGPMAGGFDYDTGYVGGGGGGGVTYDVYGRGGNPDQFSQQASGIAGAGSVGGSFFDGRSLTSPKDNLQALMLKFR